MTKLVLRSEGLKVKVQAGGRLVTGACSFSVRWDAWGLIKSGGSEGESLNRAILTFWIPSSFTHTFEKICLNILLRAKAKNRMAPRCSLWLISSRISQASSWRTSTDWRDSLQSWKEEGKQGHVSEKEKSTFFLLKSVWPVPNDQCYTCFPLILNWHNASFHPNSLK